MSELFILEVVEQSVFYILIFSALPLFIASCISIFFSVIQTLTSVQEQSIIFFARLLSVGGTLYFLIGIAGEDLLEFCRELFSSAML